MMSASGQQALGDRKSPTPFPCPFADGSAIYTPSCSKCAIKLPSEYGTIEFCNHSDHRLGFSNLVSFVGSKAGLGEFQLALEEDDTIVSDTDYLQCLDEGTRLKLIYSGNTIQVDGASANTRVLSEIEKADREILFDAARKLQQHPGLLVVLSQDELQVLHEADGAELQSLIGLSSKDAVDDLQALCFDLYLEREGRREKLDYLDLVRRANTFAKKEFDMVQADGGSEGSHSRTVRASSSQEDQADGVIDTGARGRLLQRLRRETGAASVFTAMLSLTAAEYKILLEGDCLSDLGLPEGTTDDTRRFCKEQLKLKQHEQTLRGYFKAHSDMT